MDSSAPRDSQELLHLLAESSNDVVWTMSPSGEITYVSPAVERMRGVTAEEAKVQTLDEIHPPDSAAITLKYFTDLHTALAEGREPPRNFRGELEYFCKDGSTVWTEVQVTPRYGPDGALVEILGVTRDISERKSHEAALQEARDAAEVARLAMETERSRQEERERMARDLHDDLLQTLASVKLDLATVEMRAAEPERARETLGRSRDDLTRAIAAARRLVTGLRARELEGQDLVHALEALVEEAARRSDASCTFVCLARDIGRPPPDVEECLYRVAQEALTNAVRHARATVIRVSLTRTDDARLVLRVEDDGRGLDPASPVADDSFGLRGMRERVAQVSGALDVLPGVSGGTTVEATVPVPA
jgi:PAS domain S-box-containing protein